MTDIPQRITLDQWDRRYDQLCAAGMQEPDYGGPLRRHVDDGDLRLLCLQMDNSAAALRLWNFLLTEDQRLHRSQAQGKKLVGTMKDLGTVPVMAYALDSLVAFYPDGAWWIPCLMQHSDGLLQMADRLGIDESFCPVRAMVAALVNECHFPAPALLTCSVGATCDDVSVMAQRLQAMGFPIHWWEVPHRRAAEDGEAGVGLPGGFRAPQCQVAFVKSQLQGIREVLETYAGKRLDEGRLAAGIRRANLLRQRLGELRQLVFTTDPCPLPALEMLIAEMLAIHFCSDQQEAIAVIDALLAETQRRLEAGSGVLAHDAVRVFWVNPVADLRVMNLLEDVGGRLCGSELLFCHALDLIPENLPPLEALARMALADPMVGPAADRADRIARDAARFGAEALVISRIPGASHCATETVVIAEEMRCRLGLPVLEMEVPPITDALQPTLRTRLEALIETVTQRRRA